MPLYVHGLLLQMVADFHNFLAVVFSVKFATKLIPIFLKNTTVKEF